MTDGIMLTIGEDGSASLYDDTYDITIHCESKEEQDEVKRALQNMPHWIPVTERLPEENGEYLCQEKQGFLYVDTWNGEYWDCAERAYGTVSAWMPLPEPYEEVTE